MGEGEVGHQALDLNVAEADLMRWKVRNVAPATPASTGSALALPQRANKELRGVGYRMKGQRGQQKICA